MKVLRGIRLAKKAIFTAVFACVRLHSCFRGVFAMMVINGNSSRAKVVANMVCDKLCMYHYLELHQEPWLLRPMDYCCPLRVEGSGEFNPRAMN